MSERLHSRHRRIPRSWTGWLALTAAAGVVIIGVAAVASAVLLGESGAPVETTLLEPPARGEVRPDYLADGTPVWVVGHDDRSASVISGFDTHTPSGLNKLLWWCAKADAFENPHHGSKFDEYGARIGGPAPNGLGTFEVATSDDGQAAIRALRPGAPFDAPHVGPPESEREWCRSLDDGTRYHTFDGWKDWTSPTEAVEAAPDAWILLSGSLDAVDGEARICSLTDGCADSVRAANVQLIGQIDPQFGPLGEGRFIARVRDGVFVGVTRVLLQLPAQ